MFQGAKMKRAERALPTLAGPHHSGTCCEASVMATGQSTATHDSTPEPSSQSDRRRQSGRFAKGFSYSPTTQIQPGQHLSSATEIQSGQRLSPKTEFKKGQAARNKLPLGSVTV